MEIKILSSKLVNFVLRGKIEKMKKCFQTYVHLTMDMNRLVGDLQVLGTFQNNRVKCLKGREKSSKTERDRQTTKQTQDR